MYLNFEVNNEPGLIQEFVDNYLELPYKVSLAIYVEKSEKVLRKPSLLTWKSREKIAAMFFPFNLRVGLGSERRRRVK